MDNATFRKRWFILAAISAGAFMGTLDSSIVNIALPTLCKVFSIETETVSLAVSSYLIVITGFLVVAGRIGDIHGRKKAFIMGLGVFTIGSLGCALSISFSMMVGSRIIQGLGGSMITGNSSALVTDNFPATERGKALGLIGTVVSIGLTIGPPLGGMIVQHLGWRYIFIINLPVGIAAIAGCMKLIPETKPSRRAIPMDRLGAILLPLLMLSLIIGVDRLGKEGFSNTLGIVSLIVFPVLSVLFYRNEIRNRYPLIDIKLFFQKRFFFSNVAGFLSYFALIFIMLLIPFYNEDILNLSTSASGKVLLTLPLVWMVLAPLSGAISDRIGQRVLASAGLTLVALGVYSLLSLDQFGSSGQVAFRLLIIGVGFGFFNTPNNSAIMGALPPPQRGLASGMLATSRNLGMALGVTVSATMFTTWKNVLIGKGLDEGFAFIQSFHGVLSLAILILLAGVIASLMRGSDTRGFDRAGNKKIIVADNRKSI
jgi:EmrB/QacA subfamily drug resistance transporter